MKKFSEYLLSEKVTAGIAALVVIGVVFGMVADNQRDEQVERAKDSLAAARAQFAAIARDRTRLAGKSRDLSGEEGLVDSHSIVCDASLLEPDLLANDYLELKLQPTQRHPLNPSEGNGPGVFINSRQKEDGDDSYVSVNKLYKALRKGNKEALRGIEIEKDDRFIQYSVLLSEDLRCAESTSLGTQ